MEEQNKFFCREMIAMARGGHDEEDGWTKLSRLEPEGIDVFERKVTWSPAYQMRSRWTASCGVEHVAGYFLSGADEQGSVFESESRLQSSSERRERCSNSRDLAIISLLSLIQMRRRKVCERWAKTILKRISTSI